MLPALLRFGQRLPGVVTLLGVLAPAAFGAELAGTEELIKRWVQLRTEAGRIESDWQWQRSVLRTTQEALQYKVRRLEAERELEKAAQEQLDRDHSARSAENQTQQDILAAVDRELKELSARAVALQRWLPPRLATAVELPLRSLADPDLPPSDRMQVLATFQNRCSQFNRVVTYSEEVLVLKDHDQPRVMEVLYWGLAAAYALDRERNLAYSGFPSDAGWTWEPLPEAASDISRLIAVHRDELPPTFVDLPLQVWNPAFTAMPASP